MTGFLSVGSSGVGNLDISNGGAVVDFSAASHKRRSNHLRARLDLDESKQPHGRRAPVQFLPEVQVTNGGKLISSSASQFTSFTSTIGGQFTTGTGRVTIDGIGSNWTHTGLLTIGAGGQLFVNNGGTLFEHRQPILATAFSAALLRTQPSQSQDPAQTG